MKHIALPLVVLALLAAGCWRPLETPLERAQQQFVKGNWDEAINYCDQALQANPQDAEALLLRGRIRLVGKLDPVQAVEDFSAAARSAPTNAEPLHHRAIAYRQLGQIELALADETKARELDPKYKSAYANEMQSFVPAPLPEIPEDLPLPYGEKQPGDGETEASAADETGLGRTGGSEDSRFGSLDAPSAGSSSASRLGSGGKVELPSDRLLPPPPSATPGAIPRSSDKLLRDWLDDMRNSRLTSTEPEGETPAGRFEDPGLSSPPRPDLPTRPAPGGLTSPDSTSRPGTLPWDAGYVPIPFRSPTGLTTGLHSGRTGQPAGENSGAGQPGGTGSFFQPLTGQPFDPFMGRRPVGSAPGSGSTQGADGGARAAMPGPYAPYRPGQPPGGATPGGGPAGPVWQNNIPFPQQPRPTGLVPGR